LVVQQHEKGRLHGSGVAHRYLAGYALIGRCKRAIL
jgi:hypothetical protein